MALFSIRMLIRAQFSLRTAWFGQQSILAGSFGGATRRDGSIVRQSPRGKHGGRRQLSCNAGTHTSCESQPLDVLERRQFFKPHQIFEHFGFPFTQMQELQFVSSLKSTWLSLPIALYGDIDVVFKQTDDGSDNTVLWEKLCCYFEKRKCFFDLTYVFRIAVHVFLLDKCMCSHQYRRYRLLLLNMAVESIHLHWSDNLVQKILGHIHIETSRCLIHKHHHCDTVDLDTGSLALYKILHSMHLSTYTLMSPHHRSLSEYMCHRLHTDQYSIELFVRYTSYLISFEIIKYNNLINVEKRNHFENYEIAILFTRPARRTFTRKSSITI